VQGFYATVSRWVIVSQIFWRQVAGKDWSAEFIPQDRFVNHRAE